MNAVAVDSMYVCRTARQDHEYFVVEVTLRLADGSKKKLRRHFPTRGIAELVKADLATRPEHVVDCFNKESEWQRSETVNNAYREWIKTLSVDERIAFAVQKNSPAAELDPEILTIIEARERERLAESQAKMLAKREERLAATQAKKLAKGNSKPQREERIRFPGVSLSKNNCIEISRYADGKRQRLRRTYPTREIAERALADLVARPEYRLQCVTSGTMWEDSLEVQTALIESARLTEERSKSLKAERNEKRRQIAALQQRPSHMAAPRQQRRERTPEEIAANVQRGLEAKARSEAQRRERQLAALERQAETQRARELAKAREEQFRKEKLAERQRERQAELLRKREIRLQIIERGVAEREERRQFYLDKKTGVLDFHGAESLLKFCESGLLTKDQARTLARLDADPDVILNALSRCEKVGPPCGEPTESAVSETIDHLLQTFGSIPPDEDITRFSIRASGERCRREQFHVKTGEDVFGTFYGDDDEDDWLTEEPDCNVAVSTFAC